MKNLKFDRIISVVVIGICLVKAVLYGGSKAPTNPPPNLCGSAAPNLRLATSNLRLATCNPQLATSIAVWNKRGAYNDWHRLEFPSDFAFPSGTNLLRGITVMAYGELRESLAGDVVCSLAQPPAAPLSIEPDNSSVSYGLTASNTFLIAWQNACVDRDLTNRIDASIELFRNGDMAISTAPLDSVSPSTFVYIPAQPPEGFVGEGQNDVWLAAAFPDDYAAITNKGYETWLLEDRVGINEQNGIYEAAITVGSLPAGIPTYLVCGPYKVVVTSSGTYRFPLEVFEEYHARTYPMALPLSIAYDDGYRGEAPAASPSPSGNPLSTQLQSPTFEYTVCNYPTVIVSPDRISLNEAQGAHVSIWCNMANAVRRYCALASREFRLVFCNPTEAEIEAAFEADAIKFIVENTRGSASGYLYIVVSTHCCCDHCTGVGCSCGCDCPHHTGSDNTSTNAPPSVP